MSLADMLAKSAAALTTALVPGTLTTVYAKPPEAPPPAAQLPAALQRPLSGPVDYTPSQRIVTHTWELHVLVARTQELPLDYDAALPLLEPIIAVYEASMSLGTATYFDVRPTGYEIGPASYGEGNNYLAITLTVTGKEKTAVTLTP